MSEETTKLGFEDDEPADLTKDRWLAAQRDLVTTTLDYNLQAVADLVSDGRIDLSPTFQRRERWDTVRRSRLIESFLMNVPMPPVFLNEDDYGSYSVIDGKQRLTTVANFMADRFALTGLTIFQEANGSKFSDLDAALRSVLQTRASLRAIIILRMSDPLIKYHVFQRLNTGGVRLNAQEVRNVVFAGPLNDLILDLSEDKLYRRMLRIDPPKLESSALWREMRDVELVLRYLAISESKSRYRGSLGAAMNEFMDANQNANLKQLDAYSSDFIHTLRSTYAAFGESSFRRWSPKSKRFGNQVLATLFDSQMLACRGLNENEVRAAAPSIQEGMKRLFLDEEFTRSIGSATNTTAFLTRRVRKVRELVGTM